MAKLTRETFASFREEKKKSMDTSCVDSETTCILVGVGSCGIAAGANETIKVLKEEIENKGLGQIEVKQTGCMGYCTYEPTVEVRVPGMPATIYGNIDGELARKIVEKHVVNKKLLNGHVLDKPSIDIINN